MFPNPVFSKNSDLLQQCIRTLSMPVGRNFGLRFLMIDRIGLLSIRNRIEIRVINLNMRVRNGVESEKPSQGF